MDREQEQKTSGRRPHAAVPPAPDAIQSMMAAGDLPANPAAAPSSPAASAAAPAATTPAPARGREWLWRGLLALDLAALIAVLFLPVLGRGLPEGTEARAPRPGFAVAEQASYLRALELAGAGRFDEAIEVLLDHLEANPDLAAVEQRSIHHALAMFAWRTGRTADAADHEAAMDRLRLGSDLPHDVIALAQQAEAEGRGADMRRHYARLLRQQRQLPPSLRARIGEACLRLGEH